jgi:AcrR family transcriptional regulator
MVGNGGCSAMGVHPHIHTPLYGVIVCVMSSVTVRPLPRRARSNSVAKAAVAAPARTPLTPEAWVEAATDVLVDHGIDHVRVDVLAVQLQVTRGSFYWHFRDREDLLRRVLQAWRERSTVQLTQRLANAHTQAHSNLRGDAQAQLRDVISLPFRGRAAVRAARIELAIRAWARRDPMAQEAVDEGDAARIAYHGRIFKALGFKPAEAQMRGFLLYSYEVAESLLSRQGSAASKQKRRAFVQALVVQPLMP